MKGSGRSSCREWVVNLSLLGGSLLFALVVVEVAARWMTPFPVTTESNKVPHPSLRYTLNPELPDVDENGFRNPRVRKTYDLVGIGDSHTYGRYASWRASWPHQLAELLGLSVYNMGVGSYNVYSYWRLYFWARKRLNPRAAVVALYPANDVGGSGVCRTFALDFWRQKVQDGDLENTRCHPDRSFPKYERTTLLEKLKGLAADTALGSMMKYFLWEDLERILVAYGGYDERRFFRLNDGSRTLKLSRERVRRHASYSDLDDTAVRETFRNSRRLFSQMHRDADEHDLFFGVIILPSKERVYYEWARRRGIDVPEALRTGIREQIRLTDRYRSFFTRRGIPFYEPLEDLLGALNRRRRRGEVLYPFRDGHPVEAGYRVYARAAAKLLSRAGRGQPGLVPGSPD